MNSKITTNNFIQNINNKNSQNTRVSILSNYTYNHTSIGNVSGVQRNIKKTIDKAIDREAVGGKGATLYRLQQAGMPVPEFTTIDVNTTENLEQHILDINSLKPFISNIKSFDLSVVNIANIKQYIQNKYSNQPEQRNLYLQGLAKFIASDACYQQISNSQSAKLIRENYQQLITSLPEDSAIIVRSSGIKEDNYGDAQAGKFESIVHGKQDILQTCLQVLASGFQPHVCSYSAPQLMALILQRCIDCSFGGVAMSRTSLTDHRGKIEFVPGQPKGGVSGLAGVIPHSYLISQQNDKFITEFTEGNVATQFILTQQDYNNFSEQPVVANSTNVKLTETQLQQIYDYMKLGEDILLCSADIEFAIAKDGTVYIVQLRPLTVLIGGMDFATEIPRNPLATGTLVSEGVCSGKLFYVKNQQDAATIPQGAIIVAEHGEDWMLETSFLQKVDGFIFQQGGTNDHVAITLRQQKLPCLIIPDDFAKFKTNNEIVTMACCSFNGVAGAYVVSGSEFADKLATMQSTVRSTYKPRSSETPIIKTSELSFNSPDIAFKNLHDLNYKLLDYFSADSWLTRCFTEKGMLLLAMAPHRIEIIKEATQEIQQLFADFEIFVSGYKQYLQLGIKPETASKELRHKLIEAEKLSVKFNNIKTRVNNNLDNILQQFTNVADQTINKADFNQILQDATNIFADTQQLNMPQNIDEVNSLHDCIFRMHKEFIEALAAIAINSNLGIITRYEKVDTIVFSNTQKQQELEELYAATFSELLFKKRPKIIILKNAMIATVQLGNHACTIEMLENAESGKQRTLKLKLSDDLTNTSYYAQGKLKRFWFLVQMLHNIGFDENASTIKASVEESTGILSIEINHIETKDIMLNKLKTLILVLSSMSDIDIYLNKILITQNNIDWDFSILKQHMVNLSSKRNQQCFNHAIIILGGHFTSNYNYKKFDYAKNDEFDHLFNLIEKITTVNEIPKLFNSINNIDEYALLYNLLTVNTKSLFKKNFIHLINYIKKSRPELLMNEKNVLELCSHNGVLLKYLDSNLQKNKFVVLQAMLQNIKSLQYADKELTNDDEFMITCIKYNSWALNYASDNLKNDKDIVLVAVSNTGSSLQYASDNLQNDKDIVLAAVSKIGSVLQYASDNLKNDKDIVLVAVSNTGSALRYASDNLQNDKDIVLVAISDDATALKYASDNLKNDKDVVLAAINDDAIALEYASDNLKNDKDIVLAAISDDAIALEYASDNLKNDKDIVLAAISDDAIVLEHASDNLKNDKDIVLVAISDDAIALEYASDNLKNDKDIVLAAVSAKGVALEYASDELKNNKDIVLAAISDDATALEYASYNLKNDANFILDNMDKSIFFIKNASNELKINKQFMLKAIKINRTAYLFADKLLKQNEQILQAYNEASKE